MTRGGEGKRSGCRGALQRSSPRDRRLARLSLSSDRLPTSLLICSFNTVNNWLARAYSLSMVLSRCGVKDLFRQMCSFQNKGIRRSNTFPTQKKKDLIYLSKTTAIRKVLVQKLVLRKCVLTVIYFKGTQSSLSIFFSQWRIIGRQAQRGG